MEYERTGSGTPGGECEGGFQRGRRVPVRGRAAIEKRYSQAGGALAFATADSVGYIMGAFARQEGAVDLGKSCWLCVLTQRAAG